MARMRRRSGRFHSEGGTASHGKKPPVEIAERLLDVSGLEVNHRRAGETPVLYVHGVPTASWDWMPFLEKIGGVAPDLPGFGRSAKPGDFDYSIAGYDRFLESFCNSVGLERFSLVVHDWGGVGLALAQRLPERIERLVLFSCVPFLPGYRWHRIARVWRRPLLGELFMGFATKAAFRYLSRESNAAPGPLPDEFVDRVWEHFDHGTQRAILRLYRSAPERVLARAGERLGDIKCPTLILWPTKDPYIGAEFGQKYADALGGPATLEMIDGGHWTWLDQPELIERAAEFLGTRD
jgi:pimeloyl-ACP methyl ester carboxylesterase